jgi:hypothetical protein
MPAIRPAKSNSSPACFVVPFSSHIFRESIFILGLDFLFADSYTHVPVAMKTILSRNPLSDSAEICARLSFSKEDLRSIKKMNQLMVGDQLMVEVGTTRTNLS